MTPSMCVTLASVCVSLLSNASILSCIFNIAYDVASLSADAAWVESSAARLRFFDGVMDVDSIVDVDDAVDVDGDDSCVGCCSNAYFQKLLLLIGRLSLTPFGAF
jgi:hypothetical protein